MSFLKHACVVALAATLPVAAHATIPASTFNFYLEGGSLTDQVSNSPSYVSGNLQLIVRAFDASGKQIQVTSNFTGLGATSGAPFESGDLNAGSLLGGAAPGEYLTLTFNQAVNLTGVRLSGWSDLPLINDSGALSWGSKSFTLGSNNDHGLLLSTFSPVGASGTTFKLQATGTSAFRLGGLNVTAAVPEPGTYALMALGLAGLGVVARRRQA